MPNPPDLTLEAALREHLSFLFSDWGAQIVKNETGAVVIESSGFCLKTIREREFFIFFIAPTAHPHGWENADIAIAAATGEAPLDAAHLVDQPCSSIGAESSRVTERLCS
jgi:hypothetical protein